MTDSGKYTDLSREELENLLKRLEDSNEQQARYAKKQYVMSQITALCSVIVLAVVLCTASFLIPEVKRMFDDMETVMSNVTAITEELAEADLGQMVEDIDHLVTSSDQSVQEALRQINSVDIEKLNQAINDLASLIRPLAKFFGK